MIKSMGVAKKTAFPMHNSGPLQINYMASPFTTISISKVRAGVIFTFVLWMQKGSKVKTPSFRKPNQTSHRLNAWCIKLVGLPSSFSASTVRSPNPPVCSYSGEGAGVGLSKMGLQSPPLCQFCGRLAMTMGFVGGEGCGGAGFNTWEKLGKKWALLPHLCPSFISHHFTNHIFNRDWIILTLYVKYLRGGEIWFGAIGHTKVHILKMLRYDWQLSLKSPSSF